MVFFSNSNLKTTQLPAKSFNQGTSTQGFSLNYSFFSLLYKWKCNELWIMAVQRWYQVLTMTSGNGFLWSIIVNLDPYISTFAILPGIHNGSNRRFLIPLIQAFPTEPICIFFISFHICFIFFYCAPTILVLNNINAAYSVRKYSAKKS